MLESISRFASYTTSWYRYLYKTEKEETERNPLFHQHLKTRTFRKSGLAYTIKSMTILHCTSEFVDVVSTISRWASKIREKCSNAQDLVLDILCSQHL